MGGAASTVVKTSEAFVNDKKEIALPLENLTGHVRVYQHSMSGEVLVLVDQSVGSFIKDSSEWFEVVICGKQREYFDSIKLSLTSRQQEMNKTGRDSSSSTLVDAFSNINIGTGESYLTVESDRDRKSDVKGDGIGVRKPMNNNNSRQTDEDGASLGYNNDRGGQKSPRSPRSTRGVDFRADDKRQPKGSSNSSSSNTSQTKSTSSSSLQGAYKKRQFVPTPYLPPPIYHNDMTNDVRMQHLSQAGNNPTHQSPAVYFQQSVNAGGSAKRNAPSTYFDQRTSAVTTEHDGFSITTTTNNTAFNSVLTSSNTNSGSVKGAFQLQRPPGVPSHCPLCGDAFASVNVDLVDEHMEACATTSVLRKNMEEINRTLRPAIQVLNKSNHQWIEDIVYRALTKAADEIDENYSLNNEVQRIVKRVLNVSHTNTYDGRAVDQLRSGLSSLLRYVHTTITKVKADPGGTAEGEKAAGNTLLELQNFKTILDATSGQLNEKISVLAKFSRTQLNIHDFKLVRAIGKGGFGSVYLAQRTDNKKLCAIKVMSKAAIRKSGYELQILRERKALSLAAAYPDYFVRLQCAFQRGDSMFLVMEYMPGGDCMTLLNSVHKLSEPLAQHIMAQVVMAVKHLHFHGVVHRDIKPDNVMLTNRGHAKLGDFGLVAPYIKDIDPGSSQGAGSSSAAHGYSESVDYSQSINTHNAHTIGNSNSISNAHSSSAHLVAVPKRSRNHNSSVPNVGSTAISDHLWLDDDNDIVNNSFSSGHKGTSSQESSSSIFFQKPNEHLKITSQVGNYNYACPEIVISTGYDHTVDWWAVGVMTFHLLAGITPFDAISKPKTLENIVEYKVNWTFLPDKTSDACRDFIAGIITKTTEKRLGYYSSDQVTNHLFFSTVDFQSLYQDFGPYYPLIEGQEGKEFFCFTTLTEDEAYDIPDFLSGAGDDGDESKSSTEDEFANFTFFG